MKKTLLCLGLIIAALSITFTGCKMGNDNGNQTDNQTAEAHNWTATSIIAKEAESSESKISTYYNVIIAGTFSKSDFVIKADDSYYFTEYAAESAGTTKYKDVSADTTLSVNGKAVANDETFTVEVGKAYELVFTYKTFTAKLNLTGSSIGSFTTTDEITIENIEKEPISDITGLYVLGISGSTLLTTTVRFENLTSDKVTVFTGSDASNLTKIAGELSDYAVNTTDKVMYIYNEKNLSSTAAATTAPCIVKLDISPLSDVKNLKLIFNAVTANEEINLLKIFKNYEKISCFDESTQIGKLSVFDSDGKIRSGLKFEIFETKDLSGDPIATINSSTTTDDKWTPGTGTEISKWRNSSTTIVNGVTKITHSEPYTEYNYFVKITYTYDAGSSITSSNVFKTDSDGKEYAYILNFIRVK